MSPSTEVIFQQLCNTENSVLVSALRGHLSDLQDGVKELKSLWKEISQAKDKQLVLEARKSFSNEALQILLGKLSDVKAIEELKEKAQAYFKESQARKEAQEVNKGQAAGGVAGIEVVSEEMRSGTIQPLSFADLDLLDLLPLVFPHREALYKNDWSNSGALKEEHGGEFGGICELELPDKVVEVGDQIYTTTVHLLPSVVEIQASQTMSQQLAQAFAAKAML
ncbi:hypothetical protein E4T56_gene18428 [Termitomyces sp. T112]|nr:hypothetical protein E4T56_gene18428 [Termitomyces sp. T112]